MRVSSGALRGTDEVGAGRSSVRRAHGRRDVEAAVAEDGVGNGAAGKGAAVLRRRQSGSGRARSRSLVAETSPRSGGTADQRSATAPATCGAEADVPGESDRVAAGRLRDAHVHAGRADVGLQAVRAVLRDRDRGWRSAAIPSDVVRRADRKRRVVERRARRARSRRRGRRCRPRRRRRLPAAPHVLDDALQDLRVRASLARGTAPGVVDDVGAEIGPRVAAGVIGRREEELEALRVARRRAVALVHVAAADELRARARRRPGCPSPSSPTARLAVAVPWPSSSQGAAASDPQGFPADASWTASCQL